MLPRWNSRSPLATALRERECPRCHREVDLPLGALCQICVRAIQARSRRVARVVAAVSAAGLALYALTPPPATERERAIAIAAVLVWYVLSYVVVRRVMDQWVR